MAVHNRAIHEVDQRAFDYKFTNVSKILIRTTVSLYLVLDNTYKYQLRYKRMYGKIVDGLKTCKLLFKLK